MPTKYAPTSREESEVVIRLDRVSGEARLSSTWPGWSAKLERLYGRPDKESVNGDAQVTCAFWTVPIQRVSFRRGPKQLTADQRQAMGARLRAARFPRVAPQGTREIASK